MIRTHPRLATNIVLCSIALFVGIALLAVGYDQDNSLLLYIGFALTVVCAFLGIVIMVALR